MSGYKGRKCEEKDVSSYWITLKKREGTENLERKNCIAVYGEFALEEAMDLS
jgi:hypothetical protein